MAEIQFERRGRPLWLVLLVVLVVVGAAYFGWTSCASLQRQRTLEPTGTPTQVPAAAPGAPAPAASAPRP